MSYINTSRKSRLTINGVDESSRMISWSADDDSLFKNGIMRTSGRVILGTTALSQYDYQREAYRRGQTVQMELWNADSQEWELHPRGLLYVISTAFSAETQQVTLEIGCKLAIWTLSDNIDEVYEYSVTELSEGQRTIQNISQGLYSSNKCIYQDNTGTIQTRDIFDLSSATDSSTVPATWFTGSKAQAVSAAPLDDSELPDIIDLEYSHIGSEIFTEQEKISTETSSYDIVFNAATWARTGSGDELNSTSSIDESYSGLPGAAVGAYEEITDQVKVSSSRTETTTEYYNGPGGQVTRSVQEVYLPGVEIKSEYFEDQYSACRYQAALDGDADTTSCSYLQGTSPMLSGRTITSITYDDNGTVTSRRVEVWKPVLAAAQSFNWKSGDGEYGQPENFSEVSLTDLYRDSIVITDYSQNEDGDNVETITTYRSGAVEYSAGIYATTGVIGSAELSVSEPSAYPSGLQGVTTLNLPTETVTGTGSGLTVNVAWSANTGSILELSVTSPLSDCQWGVGPLPNDNVYPLAARSDEEEALRHPKASALMFWGALPDNGPRLHGAWSGGSGTGFDGYVPTSSLPSISSSVTSSQNKAKDVDLWDVYVTSTDFVGPATEVIEITDGGTGYEVGDVITWTNDVTAAQQYGEQFADLGQALVTDYGQSLSTTAITAQVTSVNAVKPQITVVDNGSDYEVGDEVRVTAAALSAATGEVVTDDLVFTIISGESGVPNVGSGIASLSQTDYASSGGSSLDQYASDAGTTVYDFRYTGSDTYPTTLVSVDGSPGSTGAFTAYDSEGDSIVQAYQITPFAVRNNGMMFIDNGYIKSPGFPGSYLQAQADESGTTETLRWESWVYVDSLGTQGASLVHFGGESTPSDSGSTSVPGSATGLWGLYLKGGNINFVTYEKGLATDTYSGMQIRENAYLEDVLYAQPIGNKSFAYPTQEWFHVAVTVEAAQPTLYLNGKVNVFLNGVIQYSETPSPVSSTYPLPGDENGMNYGTLHAYTGAGGFVGSSENEPEFNAVVSHPPAATSADSLQVTDTEQVVDEDTVTSLTSSYETAFTVNNALDIATTLNVQTVPPDVPVYNFTDYNVNNQTNQYLPTFANQWFSLLPGMSGISIDITISCKDGTTNIPFAWRVKRSGVVHATGTGNGTANVNVSHSSNTNWTIEWGRQDNDDPASNGPYTFKQQGTRTRRTTTYEPGTPESVDYNWRLLENGVEVQSGTDTGSASLNAASGGNATWEIQVQQNGTPATSTQTLTLDGTRTERSTVIVPGGPLTPEEQFVRMALSQTKLSVGDAVYTANFTPIDVNPTPAEGTNTLNAGIYENVALVPTGGSGKAASANVEIILGGGSGAGGSGWDPCFVTPAIAYTRDIGNVTPTGGTGSGMILTLGIGYSDETYTTKSPIVIREVADAGSGYANGDILTISVADIEALLAPYGGGSVDNAIRFSITPDVEESDPGIWMFPDVVGTQFAVGDTVKVTQTALQAAGGGDAGQDISSTVTAVTPERSLQNLTLDAINGGKRVVINTSSTDSSLPDSPDTNSTPNLPTLQSKLLVPVRTDNYEPTFGGKADETEETLQVPSSYTSLDAVSNFAQNYSAYLKNFVIGEGYGLRIGEAMRDEIMTSWVPMAGLRYADERIGETFAMRADAASWGVSTEEAAVVYNGTWLGEVVYGATVSGEIDGGDLTLQEAGGSTSDAFDGGNFSNGTSVNDNQLVADGGDFNVGGDARPEDYLDVGKVCEMQLGLSFDADASFTLNIYSSSALPVSVDWEGSAITEDVSTLAPAHSYTEGEYTAGVYRDSSSAGGRFCPLFDSSSSAQHVTSVAILPGATLPPSMWKAFRGCSNLTSVTISPDADFSSCYSMAAAWQGTAIRSFPLVTGFDYTRGGFSDAWKSCASLVDFPANFFDNFTGWASSQVNPVDAWFGCALSAKSIQNILVSLDTATAPATGQIRVNGGTSASYSTWSTAAKAALTSLQAKGYTVLYNA